jgi:uncharacterized protein (TIGR04222 family)
MVNPFDLRGPEFLLFYLCLGAGITVLAYLARRSGERADTPPRPLSDYLEIAFLRGGASEAIRVAVLTLLERGVLAISGTEGVKVAQPDAARRLTRRTEQAIVARAAQSATPAQLIADADVSHAVSLECEPGLVRLGLLPTPEQRSSRMRLFLLAGGTLGVVASIKIAVAVIRGRSNVGFLVILGIAFIVAAFIATHPRLTAAGKDLVDDLRTLFSGLKDRAASMRPQQGGTDFALLAAVYGVSAALPVYPDAQRLFPRATESSSSSGSSCGSSCGSSGGSSCGGGGGGCGGCGS